MVIWGGPLKWQLRGNFKGYIWLHLLELRAYLEVSQGGFYESMIYHCIFAYLVALGSTWKMGVFTLFVV